MAEGDAVKVDKYDARLTQAVENLRSNAKWTLVAFGAIGTTLLAGSQLSSLGKFAYDEPRLWFALFCALVALGVAALAVRSTSAIAYSGYVELNNLEQADIDYAERNPALLEGFRSVADLKAAYEDAITDRHEGFFAGHTADELQNAENWYRYIDTLVDKVLSYIRYNKIRQQSERSRTDLTRASIAAAAALVGFAWAANPAGEQSLGVQTVPARATLNLTEAGRAALAPMLGGRCAALRDMGVVILGLTTSGPDIVTLGDSQCSPVRFTLTTALGSLNPASPARP
ncbi:MAG TPA: hypothetical protein VNR39_06880 [Pseudolabrys sp.]|nr:hypothetical protein [Pseudolabrys sp.]